MGTSLIDLELVQRVQAGDKKSFDVLVLKYQHKVINLVMRYMHDPDTAQDVAQEAFIKAYRGLKNFRGESAFYTWLYRIAINTAKNHLVSQGRRAPTNDIDAEEAEQFEGESALKEYGTPENEMLRDEIQSIVSNAIDALPDDLRTAIVLRELEGMSYEEIAEAM
ncbi:MAG: RNA polymerase sigma factor RpoE, partial [Thiothrix sp.]